MCYRPENIALVIPVFNEALRLDVDSFLKESSEMTLIFVDDGSTDGSTALLERLQQDRPRSYLVRLPRNAGKAGAVRQGILFTQGLKDFADFEWVGYWDADLATPLQEVRNMLQFQKVYGRRIEALLGSRVFRLGSTIQRRPRRHLSGRAFATLVGLLFPDLAIYDSQCGAKLFRRELVDQAFGEPFLSEWIFDVEILLRLRSHFVVEYPLQTWRDKAGSKLKFWPTLVAVFRDLVRLKRRYPSS